MLLIQNRFCGGRSQNKCQCNYCGIISLTIMYLCACDSVHNLAPTVSVEKPEVGLVALDSALQEQERIITMSYALASEASLKSKLVTGWSFKQLLLFFSQNHFFAL